MRRHLLLPLYTIVFLGISMGMTGILFAGAPQSSVVSITSAKTII